MAPIAVQDSARRSDRIPDGGDSVVDGDEAGVRVECPHHGVGIVDGGVDLHEEATWHSADFATGDALVLTRHVIHRSLPNTTDHTLRLSLDLRYGFTDADGD